MTPSYDKQTKQERNYWLGKLSNDIVAYSLLLDMPRQQKREARDKRTAFFIEGELYTDLLRLTGESSFLAYAVLLTALKGCLWHYHSDATLITVGSPTRKRGEELLNVVPIVDKIDGQMTLQQLLIQVRETLLHAYQQQDYPFAHILQEIGISKEEGDCPLFNVVLSFDEIHNPLPPLDNDVTIYATEVPHKGFEVTIEYKASLFKESTILRFSQHFLRMVHEAVHNHQQPLGRVSILTEEEYDLLLHQWNATAQTYPAHLTYSTLFEQQVKKSPAALAVVDKDQQMTYEELNARANRLAHALLKLGVQSDTVVPLLVERGIPFLTAILAIFKAGAAYLPLDPTHPPARHRQILVQSRSQVVLISPAFLPTLSHELASQSFEMPPQLFSLDELYAQEQDDTNSINQSTPRHLAYVIYTSGSTGAPKGAMIEQRGMMNHLYAKISDLHLTPADCVAQTASQCFDISVWQFLAALLVGGTVEIVPDETAHDPERLLRQVDERHITLLEIVPSLLRAMLDGLASADGHPRLNSLRWLIPTGEALSPELCRRWLSFYPQIPLLNAYGPTECSDDVTHYPIYQPPVPLTLHTPIGRPIANTKIYILNSSLQPVPIGATGEMYVGGVGVGRGYLNDPQRTMSVFIPNPFQAEAEERLYKTGDLARYLPDGTIEFAGRADHQIKIRGYRIEPGEIEGVLEQHPAVRQVAIMPYELRPGDHGLVAYVVPKTSKEIAERRVEEWRMVFDTAILIPQLRDFLRERLPDYMVPAVFLLLDTLPMTANGKLDRNALPSPNKAAREETYVAPRNQYEAQLAHIWKEVLQIEQVGIYDNFFELGGDSLVAIQIVYKARQDGILLRPIHLMQYQTIADLAEGVSKSREITAEQGLIKGEVPLTPIQQHFFLLVEKHLDHWNQSMLLKSQELLPPDLIYETLRLLLVHHDVLRSRFIRTEPGVKQLILEQDASIPFEALDIAHIPSHEQRSFIEKSCNSVQSTLNLESGPVLRGILFQTGHYQNDRLLLIIHHLVVDGMSWRILLEDFQTIYEALRNGHAPKLPAKTTSFQYWAKRLLSYASTPDIIGELDYWTEQGKLITPLPLDFLEGRNDIGSSRVCVVTLDASQTQTLLRETLALCHAQINEVLLTALVQAFLHWTGEPALYLNMESHGREDLFDDVDLSRTVGWFTAEYPLYLRIDTSKSIIENVSSIQQQLNNVPQRGFHYAIFRYLVADPGVRQKLGEQRAPEVSFNYLGQFDQLFTDGATFELAEESTGFNRSPLETRQFMIDINGAIAGNCLEFSFEYSETLHSRKTIESLAGSFLEALQTIIRSSRNTPALALPHAISAFTNRAELLPLTHTQQWFFEQEFVEMHQWNTGMIMQVHHYLEAERMRETCNHLLAQHEILNYCFEKSATGWLQYHRASLVGDQFEYCNLSMFSKAEQKQMIERIADQCQCSLNITHGPLFRMVLFDLGPADLQRLFITVHHLVIDHVSWPFLLNAIQTVYQTLEQGLTPTLPCQSTPFKVWSSHLADYARSAPTDAAFHNWVGKLRGDSPALLRDNADGLNQEQFLSEVRVVLASGETHTLLQQMRNVFQFHIADVLLSALAITLCDWLKEETILIDQGTHGREDVFDDIDLSGTIGWFTTSFPVRLSVVRSQTLLETLLAHREVLRESRRYGVLFAVQKYLHPDQNVRNRLKEVPPASVSFDYEGLTLPITSFRDEERKSWFEEAPEKRGWVRNPKEKRTHELDIRAWIDQGQLEMVWQYSSDIHTRETIERLAHNCLALLRNVLHLAT